MPHVEKPRALSFEELTVWRTELPDVNFADKNPDFRLTDYAE
jgi:hypothetical protein